MYKKVCAECMTVYDSDQTVCPDCGAAAAGNSNPGGSLPEGMLLGESYRVGRFLSIDSEGALYDAVDITTHRHFQIKEYMPITLCSGRDETFGLQVRVGSEVPFKNNAADFADLYAKLRHFNNDICLLGVREVFYANNTVYAVTENPDGVTLTRYLEQHGGRLGWNEALDLLDPLWVAVERLHRAGVIHRGICCDNITVTNLGVVRLSGFATQAMRRQGTELKAQLYTGYAAPEQYLASAFDGPFTDIYALCAVLYRVLTGVSVPAARERLNEDLLEDPSVYVNQPLPDGRVEKLPLYLADAVLHGLQLEGVERFADMTDFRRALAGPRAAAAAAGVPVKHSSAGGAVHTEPERKGLWAQMSPDLKVGLCTGAAVLLVFLAVLLIWSGKRAEKAKADPETEVSAAESQSDVSTLSESESISEAPSVSSESESVEYEKAPNLVGSKFADARLQYAFRFNAAYEFSGEYEAGVIIRQNPVADAEMKDNVMDIVISQGVQPVPMPDLEGMSIDNAVSLLESMGLQYLPVTVVNNGEWAEGVVTRTDPAAKTSVQPDKDKITVYIAGEKPEESSSEAPSSDPSSVPDESPASGETSEPESASTESTEG